MPKEMLESDWKVFRTLHKVALDRYCAKVLKKIADISAEKGKSPHDKYGEIYDAMEESDGEIADMFDNARKTHAAGQFVLMRKAGLFTEEELAKFSKELLDFKG